MDLITLALAKKAGGGGGGIPITKVSDLVNDAGYITQAALAPYETQEAFDAYRTQTATALAAKANAADVTAALAGKASTADVTAQIAAAVGDITSFEYYLCGQGEYDTTTGEPTVQNPDTNHIYLVPTSGTNLNMYAYIDSAFTFLGTTEVDLSGYATTAAMNAALALKADAADVPTVPTKVSAFQNDAEYITQPRETYFAITCDSEADAGAGIIGGLDHVYMHYKSPTETEIETLFALGELSETLYINRSDLPATVLLPTETEVVIYCNAKVPSETGAALGGDIDDPTKPFYLINLKKEYGVFALTVLGSEHIKDVETKVFSQGAYLTQHQSLSAYATKAEVNTALTGKSDTGHTHDNRYYTETEVDTKLGNKSNVGHTHAWSEITTGKPSNIVTGSAKAYSIVVSSSAPASGTADSVITIVV